MTSLKKLPDDQLVALYAQGNNDAFDILLLRHKDRLFTYINFIVHNNDVAEDIFQETFVRAITSIQQKKYSENGKFYSWLTCIAHNLLIDYFRSVQNNGWLSCEECDFDFLNHKNLSDANIETQMVYNQMLQDIKQFMLLLPQNQRDILFMRFYQDMSFKEIAEQTGVSINTALGRMRYAILNMRKMMQNYHIPQ